jgi:hypothetical protein
MSDPVNSLPERTGRPRAYWSRRKGVTPSLSLHQAVDLYAGVMGEFQSRDYLCEWFGFYCPDDEDVPGRGGRDRGAFVTRRTYRNDLWPIAADVAHGWDEDAFFTAVEFYYDHVSEGVSGRVHGYLGCGTHWDEFNPASARAEYLAEINSFLVDYGEGYELLDRGEVVRAGPPGLDALLAAKPRPVSGRPYEERLAAAIKKFRSRASSTDDRRDAVRDLADVLELLRPEVARVLTKKEDATIFELANRFGIRHMDGGQVDDYTKPVWLSWMFYFYLATINAVTHLVERSGNE